MEEIDLGYDRYIQSIGKEPSSKLMRNVDKAYSKLAYI